MEENQPAAQMALSSQMGDAQAQQIMSQEEIVAEDIGAQAAQAAIDRGATTVSDVANLLNMPLGQNVEAGMSDPALAEQQLRGQQGLLGAGRRALETAIQEGEKRQAVERELRQLQELPTAVALREPGIKKIVGEFRREVETPEEGSELFDIRQRQRELRSKILQDKESYQQAIDGLGEFKYDPYKAFPTSGAKAAALIGIAIGGIGAALKGGENQVFNYFKDVTNRELERQKLEAQNLSQKAGALKNLYTMNLELLGNEDAAEQLTLDQIAKSYSLRAEAYANDISDINKRNRALGELQIAMKKFESDRLKSRELKAADVKRSDVAYTAAQSAKKTSGELSFALKSIDSIIESLPEGENTVLSQLALQVGQSDNFAAKVLLDQFMKDAEGGDSEFQPYVELAQVLKPIAFGLAREGQSASSISNRDVQMFLDVLANPLRKKQYIRDSLEYMRSRLDRDAKINELISTNPRMLRPQAEALLMQNGIIGENIGLQAFLEKKGGETAAFVKEITSTGRKVESL